MAFKKLVEIDVQELLSKLEESTVPEIRKAKKRADLISTFLNEFNIVEGKDRISKLSLKYLYNIWGKGTLKPREFYDQLGLYLTMDGNSFCVDFSKLTLSRENIEILIQDSKNKSLNESIVNPKLFKDFQDFIKTFQLFPSERDRTRIPMYILHSLFEQSFRRKIFKNQFIKLLKDNKFTIKQSKGEYVVYLTEIFYTKVPKTKVNEMMTTYEEAKQKIKDKVPGTKT
jgi:hypothetical protein